jgi:hypothetical protein
MEVTKIDDKITLLPNPTKKKNQPVDEGGQTKICLPWTVEPLL